MWVQCATQSCKLQPVRLLILVNEVFRSSRQTICDHTLYWILSLVISAGKDYGYSAAAETASAGWSWRSSSRWGELQTLSLSPGRRPVQTAHGRPPSTSWNGGAFIRPSCQNPRDVLWWVQQAKRPPALMSLSIRSLICPFDLVSQ